jgi:hypothetical protein
LDWWAYLTQLLFPARNNKWQKTDETNPMDKKEKLLQQVCGTLLYYARPIDTTMSHALNNLAAQTKKVHKKSMEALTHFLNFCATHPDAEIIYRASDMIKQNHSDAAYLVASEARSRAGVFTYTWGETTNPQIISGAISAIAKIIKSVMSSAAEAEVGALFMNAKEILPLTAFKLLSHIWDRKKGSFFLRGVSPSKMGPKAPS